MGFETTPLNKSLVPEKFQTLMNIHGTGLEQSTEENDELMMLTGLIRSVYLGTDILTFGS